MRNYISSYLKSFQNDFNNFVKKSNKDIIIAAKTIAEAFNNNKKLLICEIYCFITHLFT